MTATAKQLARALGVGTGDEVLGADAKWASEAPPTKMRTATGREVAIEWTQRRRDLFNFLSPVSISLVTTDGPYSLVVYEEHGGVARRLGHNRAVRPARLVKGTTRRDAATQAWDRFPGARFGTKARLWCLREADRDRLALALVDLMAARAERDGGLDDLGQPGAHDMGPEFDVAHFEIEMHTTARDGLGIQTWDDFGLVRFFDSIGAAFDRLKAEQPGRIVWDERLVRRIAETACQQQSERRG